MEEPYRGAGRQCGAWLGRRFLPKYFPPSLLAILTKAEQVASSGVWRLHTDELGPDLTEAGTFLKEEGFNKECSPQLGLRSGLTIPGPASLAGVIGLRDVSWEMRCERP